MRIGSCRYADNPTEDMEWLGKGCTELACQRDLPGAADSHTDASLPYLTGVCVFTGGVESGKYCHVKQRVWQSSCGGQRRLKS